jgi:hypothetical protein
MIFPKMGNGIKSYIIKNDVHNMSKRVTIMLDNDLDKKMRLMQAKMIQSTTNKKMRLMQAKMIQSTTSSVSFSNVLNTVLRDSLKK